MGFFELIGVLVAGLVVYTILVFGLSYVITADEKDTDVTISVALAIGAIMFLIVLMLWYMQAPCPFNPQ